MKYTNIKGSKIKALLEKHGEFPITMNGKRVLYKLEGGSMLSPEGADDYAREKYSRPIVDFKLIDDIPDFGDDESIIRVGDLIRMLRKLDKRDFISIALLRRNGVVFHQIESAMYEDVDDRRVRHGRTSLALIIGDRIGGLRKEVTDFYPDEL